MFLISAKILEIFTNNTKGNKNDELLKVLVQLKLLNMTLGAFIWVFDANLLHGLANYWNW